MTDLNRSRHPDNDKITTKESEAMRRHLNSKDARATGTDLSFVALRLGVSAVLVWGALTKLAGGEGIDRLTEIWGAAGLPQPEILVTLSISLQLILALLLLIGLFTRTAGLLNGMNFAVGAAISGIFTSAANWWPFALLVLLLLHFGLRGGGTLSIDGLRSRRLAARSLEDLLTSMGIKPQQGDGNYPGHSSG